MCARCTCQYFNSDALGVPNYNITDWDDNEYDPIIKIVYDDDGTYVSHETLDQDFEDANADVENKDEFLVRTSREEQDTHPLQLTHSDLASMLLLLTL